MEFGGFFALDGDGIRKTIQSIEVEVWAKEECDRILDRSEEVKRGPCPYCGSHEDICENCGCCKQDHAMFYKDNISSPEELRYYGLVRYIRAVNAEDDTNLSTAMFFIAHPEEAYEHLLQIVAERQEEIDSIEESINLNEDTWSAIDDLDMDILG